MLFQLQASFFLRGGSSTARFDAEGKEGDELDKDSLQISDLGGNIDNGDSWTAQSNPMLAPKKNRRAFLAKKKNRASPAL